VTNASLGDAKKRSPGGMSRSAQDAPVSTLDVLRFPLWGSRLIEASAGTGKTWTIAALYLRLVLGHADPESASAADDAGETALRAHVPSEILVMTFTKAATRELSDRIRSRLLEAARCFRGEAQPQEGDALLAGLMQAYPEGPARTGAAWRLSLAAESMDDAAVHTIDAWCQRMLREHAFDSGCLFDEELSANETAMQTEAAHDYWRQQVYPLEAEQLDTVLRVWSNVGVLTEDARKLVEKELPPGVGDGGLGELIERLRAEQQATLQTLKEGWVERAREMQAWLDVQLAAKPSPFGKSKPRKADCTRWLTELAAWARDPVADDLKLNAGSTKLTHTCMQEALIPDAKVKLPEHFAAFETLMQAIAGLRPLKTLKAALRLHAAARIARRLATLKEQARTFGFADMLARLDKALDQAANGDNARRLRERILAQYPVALIDEFQDTSPVQSRIFDRLYRVADNDPKTALLLIGDPKQAIYGFRGADIYSYLDARRKTDGRHYVLGTNHRSTVPLVNAVNHVFAQAEARPGHGAFLFRTDASADSPAANNPLPFVPVGAAGRAESFVTSEGAGRAVTLALDEELASGKIHMRQFAARCAERIVTLLNDVAAGFQHATKGFRRLRPADIAVLVRTGREGLAVKRELRRRNVASVYLSDTESVFDSDEARDLLPWLRAVASPRDAQLARAAFATRSVGLSLEELAQLAADDVAFDVRSDQLRDLHRTWQEQGVLTMLRQSLHLLELPARWLGAAGGTGDRGSGGVHDGERRLTNYLHLAELLQNASAQLDGEQALIRWLANQLEAHGVGDDEQIVRLESDADLVKLVTVHKAKGLEYPLVFLPFPYIFRPVPRDESFVVLPGESGTRELVMEPTLEQVQAADIERQREDLRLLYVALTRARHSLWVGLAALQRYSSNACLWHESAIGYLLGGSQPVDASAFRARIAALVEPCEQIALVAATPVAEIQTISLVPRDPPSRLRPPPTYAAAFDRRWSIGSFSALVRALPPAGLWASSMAAVRDDEALQPALLTEREEGEGGERMGNAPDGAAGAAAQRVDAPALFANVSVAPPGAAEELLKPWHRFPRGAFPGNFLHDQLQWLGEEGFGLDASLELQQQLQRRCERQGWGHRADDVVEWLRKALATPLPPLGAAGVALDSLTGHLPEMEFWFPSESLPSRRIDALCRARTLHGRDRPALPERELRGMLMGFADLIFQQGGRYWVLDYKSNHLGMSDGDYSEGALEQAMAAHRYDVQAAIYLLALHRLLKVRLGASYKPAKHLGGAIYFFLRGIEGPTRGCYLVPADPKLLDGIDVLLRTASEGKA
jgi:exodeoxyribonuclease V beta subunit